MNAQFTQEKREAIESFLRFAAGQEMPRWPLEVFLEVSNICDLQCAMCPTFSALNVDRFFALKREDRGVIAYETATEPLEEILKHALVIHASGYGEPTIHPQYRELLTYLARYEALIDFFTNGMHLDEDFCRFLVERRIHRIAISFSGATAEEYENIYIGGDFARVLAGIRRLRQARDAAGSHYPRIEINSIAFRHHIENLPAFVRLMGEAGADIVHIKPLRLFSRKIAELRHHESHMHPEREAHLVREAKAVAAAFGIHLASAPYEATQRHALNYERAFNAMPDEEREQLYQQILDERIPVSALKEVAMSAAKREQKREALTPDRKMRERRQLAITADDFMVHTGAPCLEPFKTFHASFDGRVRTCCFTGTKHWIGHLEQENGAQIWNNPVYREIRQRAVHGEYQTLMCKDCLRKSSYPKSHDLPAEFNSYCRWYEDVHGQPFLPDLRAAVMAVPAGGEILANFQHQALQS